MNIFVVSKDPIIAAKSLNDRHIVKMPLETAQMLSAVADRYGHPSLYKVSFKKHPCTLWAGDSYDNWMWLIKHGIALSEEYTARFGKIHTCESVIKWYLENNYGPPESLKGLTPFAQAMPDEYRHENPVVAYRAYYLGDKQFFKDGKRPTWKNASPPKWWYFVK